MKSITGMNCGFVLVLLLAFSLCFCGCGDDDDDNNGDSIDDDDNNDDATDDDDDNDDDDDDNDDDDNDDDDSAPDDIVDPPDEMPFTIARDPAGQAPTQQEIADFTQTMKGFFEGVDYFGWASRHSIGLAPNNSWGEPSYKIWWTNAYAAKEGDLVTITFHEPPDNTTAKSTRILPGAIGMYLSTGDEDARELALGFIKGLSATYDGMVWGEEDPVIDYLMARTIFHRSHTTESDDGRRVGIDYEPVRYEVIQRRHDTVHNPNNPTWGDIYVRNKRSKDDFPYLYRDMPFLARLIRETDDPEMKEAAIKLYRHVVRMTQDIVQQGYIIRTKGAGGEPFIPRTDQGFVDDFAIFGLYDFVFPQSECNAKIGTAYLASGTALDNDCRDGDGGLYELIAILGHYWGSNMIWGYHVTAISLALAFGDYDAARGLLEGLATRMDELMVHPLAPDNIEWYPDLAQLLVLGASYGLPLTNEEAQLVIEYFTDGADYYNAFPYWDLWDDAFADGDYEYMPDRYEYDGGGQPIAAHVRITEIVNLYEYCYSPLKDPAGAAFIDCDALLATGK